MSEFDNTMSEEDTPQRYPVSRRRFMELAGIAGLSTTATESTAAQIDTSSISGITDRTRSSNYYVGPESGHPTDPSPGTMYFEIDTGERVYYDGEKWISTGNSTSSWNIIDVVEAGADPTGEEPIDAVLEDNYTGSEMFYFPEGTYTMQRPFEAMGTKRVGFVGQPEATIRAAEDFGWSHMMIEAGDPSNPVEEVYVENITFDLRDATPDVGGVEAHFSNTLTIENVTVTEGVGKWMAGLLLTACDKDAHGRVNVDLSAGSSRLDYVDDYSYQPIGILIEDQHKGRIVLDDCIVGRFPNNGVYGSQGTGRVDVIGGRYYDSDISSLRIGSNCSVRGATIRIDNATDTDVSTVGIRVKGKQDGNVLIENTRIETTNTCGHGLMVRSDGPVTIRDSIIIRTGSAAGGYAFYISDADGDNLVGNVTFDNITVVDDSDSAAEYTVAVARPDTVIKNSTLESTNTGAGGVFVKPNGDNIKLIDSVVDVPGYPLSLNGKNITLQSNTFPQGKVIPLPTEGDSAVAYNTFHNDGLWIRDTSGEISLTGNVGITVRSAGVTKPYDGGSKSYAFPHDLTVEPNENTSVVVHPATEDAAAPFYVDIDDTHIFVTYPDSTPSGTDNLKWRYSTEHRP